MINASTLLESVYQAVQAGHSRMANMKLMDAMEGAVTGGNFHYINDIFNLVDVTRLGPHALVGLIRSSSRYRQQIPLWQETYESVWKEAIKQGHNPATLFVGLQQLTWL